jgi:hypothetical protein
MELMNLRLCGEAQIITEPYRPNPCETCATVQRPTPLPGSNRIEDAQVIDGITEG